MKNEIKARTSSGPQLPPTIQKAADEFFVGMGVTKKIPLPVMLPGEYGRAPQVIGFLWFTEKELAQWRRKKRPSMSLAKALRGSDDPFYLAHFTQGIEGLNGKDMWDGASPRFVNPGEKIYL